MTFWYGLIINLQASRQRDYKEHCQALQLLPGSLAARRQPIRLSETTSLEDYTDSLILGPFEHETFSWRFLFNPSHRVTHSHLTFGSLTGMNSVTYLGVFVDFWLSGAWSQRHLVPHSSKFDQKGILSFDDFYMFCVQQVRLTVNGGKRKFWEEIIVVPQVALVDSEHYDDRLGMYVSVVREKTRRCGT